MISLRGKRAIVTGGSRGIGAAVALLLAECGADVGIGYRSRERDAAAVVRQIADRGVRAFAHASDIATREGAEALFERAVREFGGLDLFVGNAGIWPAEAVDVASMDDERWARTMAQNVSSMFYTARAAARLLGMGLGSGGRASDASGAAGGTAGSAAGGSTGAAGTGGRIVLVASTAGQRGESFHADYAASKGAMISFVKSLAVELAPRGVTVNCVAPGWVDTEMCAEPFAGDGRERIAATIPLGRIATARDIAGPIVFLCSDFARHVTGEVMNVNGGSVLCG